jgi:hypothetical protein
MRTNIELKELWRKQTVPAVNLADLLIRIENYKTSGLKKVILLNALLVLAVFFVIFIRKYLLARLSVNQPHCY